MAQIRSVERFASKSNKGGFYYEVFYTTGDCRHYDGEHLPKTVNAFMDRCKAVWKDEAVNGTVFEIEKTSVLPWVWAVNKAKL